MIAAMITELSKCWCSNICAVWCSSLAAVDIAVKNAAWYDASLGLLCPLYRNSGLALNQAGISVAESKPQVVAYNSDSSAMQSGARQLADPV